MRRSSSPSTKGLGARAGGQPSSHASSLDQGEAHGHSGGLAPATSPLLPSTTAADGIGGLTGSFVSLRAAAAGFVTITAAQGRRKSRRGRCAVGGPLPSPWLFARSLLRPSCHGTQISHPAPLSVSGYSAIAQSSAQIAHDESLTPPRLAWLVQCPLLQALSAWRVGPIWLGLAASGAERHELESFRWRLKGRRSSTGKAVTRHAR